MKRAAQAPDASSPFRRRRVLLTLTPIAGALGAFLGIGLGLGDILRLGWLPPEDLSGLSAAAYFLAGLITLVILAHGSERGRPIHALKASGAVALALALPGYPLGVAISSMGC